MSPMPLLMVVGVHRARVLAAAEALKAQGYEVRTCYGLSDAERSLESLSPALVIIVAGTPPDDDAIALVRYAKRTSSAAVIVCSHGPTPGLAIRALEAGADDCVGDSCSARELPLRARAILARLSSDSPPASSREAG